MIVILHWVTRYGLSVRKPEQQRLALQKKLSLLSFHVKLLLDNCLIYTSLNDQYIVIFLMTFDLPERHNVAMKRRLNIKFEYMVVYSWSLCIIFQDNKQ